MVKVISLLLLGFLYLASPADAQYKTVDLDIDVPGGTTLRATYFSPGKPGPGVLLLHQCDMDRKAWNVLAETMARQGMHVLTFDYPGYGESPAGNGDYSLKNEVNAAMARLTSMPGVDGNRLAAGGASCGVNRAIELALRNDNVRSLLLLTGPTTPENLSELKKHPNLAIFGIETGESAEMAEGMRNITATSTNPATRRWISEKRGHGVPLFDNEPTLVPEIIDWFKAVLPDGARTSS